MRKKVFYLFMVFLLLPLWIANSLGAENQINLAVFEIKNFEATVSGTTDLPQGTILTIRTGKNGANLQTALPTDLIHISTVEVDEEGKFSFQFPIYELKGIFPFAITANGTQIEQIGELIYNPTGDNVIKSFKVGTYTCQINGNNIQVTVPENINRTGMIAEFVIQKDAVCFVNGVLQVSGVTRNNFETPVIYAVTADDGTVRNYNVSVYQKESSSTGGGRNSGSTSFSSTGSKNNSNQNPVVDKEVQLKFPDLLSNHWAYESVVNLYKNKILSGYEDGTIKPDAVITREEFVQLIVNAFQIKGAGSLSFEDVSKTDWYYSAIENAYGTNLVNGISQTQFGTGKAITREDAASIVYRVIQNKQFNFEELKKESFSDLMTVSEYAREAVSKLNQFGILNGYQENQFKGKNSITRAEVCTIIFNINNKNK